MSKNNNKSQIVTLVPNTDAAFAIIESNGMKVTNWTRPYITKAVKAFGGKLVTFNDV